jgi:aspartyl-tRNA synthetase
VRDRSGIVQVVFSPEIAPETCEQASSLKTEYCIAVIGRVIEREKGTENPGLDTGQIEIMASDLTILSSSKPLPFPISEKAMVTGTGAAGTGAVAEDIRLQYRYLDLRRPSLQDNFMKRHRIAKSVRDFLDERGFLEVETPVLTKSTPEGARDYLVPSRVHPGEFYALPQSPQLFKQLLMISGFERYFQIVKCYRDEDLRPNRQPEFTQIDIEASFIDEEFIYELIEELVVRMFRIGGSELPRPFPRMTYQEAMDTTGSDRPDLRFGLRFIEATDIFKNTQYTIFKQILKRNGHIKGINVKGSSDTLSKNVLQNEYAKQIVPGFGAKGMTWMRVIDGKLESNIVQFFSEEEQQAILQRFAAENGDVLLMIADPSYQVVTSALGMLRLHIANRLDLIPNTYYPVWVTDFPLFDPSEEGVTSCHHPFTSPDRTDFDPTNVEELLSLRSRAYDIVVNGEELGGGSIRIHDTNLQHKIFKALGLTQSEIEEKFGFFLTALEYGAPPHGGIALGMDRVVSMILGTASIRDVIAFPKNRSAFCPLTKAPSPVARAQLAELGLLNLGGEQVLPGAEQEGDLLEHLSWVSRIGISENERSTINAALQRAAHLAEVANDYARDEEPLYSVIEVSHIVRDGNEARNSRFAANGELLKNAPAQKGDYFKTANILE